MELNITEEWLRKMVEKQGDTPDPAPYLDPDFPKLVKIWERELAEQQSVSGNGTHPDSEVTAGSDAAVPEPIGKTVRTSA